MGAGENNLGAAYLTRPRRSRRQPGKGHRHQEAALSSSPGRRLRRVATTQRGVGNAYSSASGRAPGQQAKAIAATRPRSPSSPRQLPIEHLRSARKLAHLSPGGDWKKAGSVYAAARGLLVLSPRLDEVETSASSPMPGPVRGRRVRRRRARRNGGRARAGRRGRARLLAVALKLQMLELSPTSAAVSMICAPPLEPTTGRRSRARHRARRHPRQAHDVAPGAAGAGQERRPRREQAWLCAQPGTRDRCRRRRHGRAGRHRVRRKIC